MKLTRKQLSSLIRECIKNRHTMSIDIILEDMYSLVSQTYSNLDTDSYSGSPSGGITMGVSDPSLAVSYESDELDEDEEMIDEDEDDIDEGEY